MRRNRRIKAKMNGPPHSRPKCLTPRSRSAFCEGKRQAPLREGQAFSSSFGRAPLPFWPGLPAQPGRSLVFPHTVSVVFTFTLNDTLPPPNPHGGQGSAIPYTARGLHPPSSLRVIANKVSDTLGFAPASLCVIARNEAIQTNRHQTLFMPRIIP